MRIAVLGAPDPAVLAAAWPEDFRWLRPPPPVPLFDLDAAFFFPGADAGARRLIERSGRPRLVFPPPEDDFHPAAIPRLVAYLREHERSNYRPIDCNFYDNFEAAIVTRREVDLEYLDPFGQARILRTRLTDLKTHRTEEFVQLAGGEWIRLDRIVAVDGVAAGASCRF